MGGVALIALSGFLIWYILKLKKQQRAKELVNQQNGVRNIRQTNTSKKTKLVEEEEEEEDDDDEDSEEEEKQAMKPSKSDAKT